MDQEYLGRIVAFAVTPSGRPAALYRVSSRSFPNRMASVSPDSRCVSIIPKPGHESDLTRNPYIAYNCARIVGDVAILSNGSHTDPVAEKVAMGMPVRDAIALSLLAMDYEKDDYNTPRIVVAARLDDYEGWLGTVREDGLDIQRFSLEPGQVAHLSTYSHVVPQPDLISCFEAETADQACAFILKQGVFAGFSNPVTAVAAVAGDDGFMIAATDLSLLEKG